MILVRIVFHAKFGKGGELARNVAASLNRMPADRQTGMRLLTGLSGQSATVVVALVRESLSAWEQGGRGCSQTRVFSGVRRDPRT
jgi:hypothetical protein